ncbi:SpoIIE family protein phosphatase [Micromonospora sp. DT227]|uniref:SpoIIE family protein phosphatase n=1 Tax=Micromonospora sp. DT227 TaxID=3393433 RepID=UPI003CF90BD7
MGIHLPTRRGLACYLAATCGPWATAHILDGPVGARLGAGIAQQQTVLPIETGSVLALQTDGLMEDRTRDIDVGLATLTDATATVPGALADHLLRRVQRHDGYDDAALLLARLGSSAVGTS